MGLFEGIGFLLACYVVLCVLRGVVHAKRGIHMESLGRDRQPGRFWLVIGIYSALAVALFTVF